MRLLKLKRDNIQEPLILGVCGRSCSGKGALTQSIISTNREAFLLQADCYFRSNTACSYNGYKCWEHTDCIYFDRLIDNLGSLKKRSDTIIRIEAPWMPHTNMTITHEDMITKNVIIVEGYLIFAVKALTSLLDYGIFIDVSDYNILVRRLRRDGFGQFNYIVDVVIPVSKEYEQEQRSRADIVIDGNGPRDNVISEATKYLGEKLASAYTSFGIDLSTSRPPWTIYPGDLIMDKTWHPVDFDNLKEWVKKAKDRLDAGEELKGNTFRYRRNPHSGEYEVRLSSQYSVYRYTTEPTEAR